MKIYKLIGESLGENTFLLEKEGKILVIDPGASSDRIRNAAGLLSGDIVAAILTHGHADHARGAAGLEAQGVPIYISEEEKNLLNGRANLALALGFSFEKVKEPCFFREGTLALPPFEISVIATPGHTAGGVCFLIEGCLFLGDTLFAGSYGNVNFPTGDEQDLLCSIANELFSLPDETPVYCGHSDFLPQGNRLSDLTEAVPDTYIGREKLCNPILDLL